MKKAVIILTVLALFISCNQQKTIQTYIVEKQDKPGFMSVDLPMSLIQLNSDKVPLDVKDGYESIKKVNVLGLPYLNNNEAYEIEKKAISLILNNSTLYKNLMKMDMNGMSVSIYYNGDANDINEVIVFGYSKKIGVGVARVIGNHMNPIKITQMAEYLKIDPNQLNLQQFKQALNSIN
jgi:spore germination protein YaaH